MDGNFTAIGEKWKGYGLRGIWRDSEGDFYIDDDDLLGPYYFGLIGDIEAEMACGCRFRDMPKDRGGLAPLWVA